MWIHMINIEKSVTISANIVPSDMRTTDRLTLV